MDRKVMHIDAFPSSLMDSITSPKVMRVKGEAIGACFLVRNTLGVERHVGTLKWD
jgi:hypothetical protein